MKKAFFLLFIAFFILISQSSILKSQSWQALMDSTNYYAVNQDFHTAIKWVKLAIPQAEKEFGIKDTNYANTISTSSSLYYYAGDLDSAIYFQEIHLKFCRTHFKIENEYLGKIIIKTATFYDRVGRYLEAEQLYKEALAMNKRLFKSDDPNLAWSINNLGTFYNDRGKYEMAEPMLKEALEMYRRFYKYDHLELANSIIDLANCCCSLSKYTDAETLYREALRMYRRLFQYDHPSLATSLNNMAYFFDARGNYAEAEPLFIEALEMRRRLYKSDQLSLAISINNMAYFFEAQGNYAEAEPLFIEALQMYRRLYKYDNNSFATTINNMAYFYEKRGRIVEAEPLLKEALEMRRRLFKSDHPDLANSINNMAMFYNEQDRIKEAEPLINEALEMFKRLYKTDNPDLANIINNKAAFLVARNRYSEAEPLYKEALDMRRRLFKKGHSSLSQSINNMASFFDGQGRFDNAEQLYKEALVMRRYLFNYAHPDLAITINCIASFYNKRDDYNQSAPLYLELINVCDNLMNNYYPSLSEKEKEQYFSTFSKYYKQFNNFAVSRYKESPKLLETMFDNQLLTKGMLLSASNKVRSSILASNDSTLIELFTSWKDRKEYISKLYQLSKAQLEKKRINLDSVINLANEQEKELTKRSEAFKNEYDKQKLTWKDVQKTLNKDEVVVEIVRLPVYGKIGKMRVPKDTTGIDSIDVDKWGWSDNINYAALIIKGLGYRVQGIGEIQDTNTQNPISLVLLENGKDLEGDFIKQYSNAIEHRFIDKDSYDAYWSNIAEELKGVKKVYVSPDGVYNQINLATLRNPKTGKYLLDEKEIVVVGSSRDLVKRKMDSRFRGNDRQQSGNDKVIAGKDRKMDSRFRENDRQQSGNDKVIAGKDRKMDSRIRGNDNLVVELFGDPKFNLDSVQHLQLASNYKNENKADMERGVMESLTTRGGIDQLPGTRKEVENIYNMFKSKGWDVRKHLGEEALEEAVKSINNPRVLLIATHGLFLKDLEKAKDDDRTFGMETKRFVENPLLRSMLLFSGAENTMTNKDESNSLSKTDDGLLTAFEAMNLNLDKTELVVLSACETGLGAIKNGEGVYGLQRAFIQAGAKSLIMSLWKVNDQSTQELMTSFYTKWLAGKTKRQAFKEAQQELKKKRPEPFYWGAFVMVGE